MNHRPFVEELAVALSGVDDPATNAWLRSFLWNHEDPDARRIYYRVSDHWRAASEDLRSAIARKLGWMSGPSEEIWPIPSGIRDDYLAICRIAGDDGNLDPDW